MKRPLGILAAALTTAALLLTGCGSSHPQGPAGRVIAKDSDRDCHNLWTGTGTKRRSHESCSTDYELTTRDKHGRSHEFDVDSAVYDNCRRGSAYPGCVDR